ncbi:unnamed protein product, partial [Gadus morhua 'NCC']
MQGGPLAIEALRFEAGGKGAEVRFPGTLSSLLLSCPSGSHAGIRRLAGRHAILSTKGQKQQSRLEPRRCATRTTPIPALKSLPTITTAITTTTINMTIATTITMTTITTAITTTTINMTIATTITMTITTTTTKRATSVTSTPIAVTPTAPTVKAWRHVPVLRFHTLRNTSRDLDLEEERSTLPEEVEGRGVLLSCLTAQSCALSEARGAWGLWAPRKSQRGGEGGTITAILCQGWLHPSPHWGSSPDTCRGAVVPLCSADPTLSFVWNSLSLFLELSRTLELQKPTLNSFLRHWGLWIFNTLQNGWGNLDPIVSRSNLILPVKPPAPDQSVWLFSALLVLGEEVCMRIDCSSSISWKSVQRHTFRPGISSFTSASPSSQSINARSSVLQSPRPPRAAHEHLSLLRENMESLEDFLPSSAGPRHSHLTLIK